MSDAITFRNVSKTYRVASVLPWKPSRSTQALRCATFSVPQDRVTCLLGPNGAGKTTILKILAGLVLPDSGDVQLLGVAANDAPMQLRGRVGLASPNDRSFYWRLTGRQNLDFFAALYGLRRGERRHRVSEVLSAIGPLEDADKPFRLFSTGMRQKLILARALLGRPEVLLLDEPTSHLDPAARDVVHRLVRDRFNGGTGSTVLLATHDLTEAQDLAEHLVFLGEGSIRAEGTLSGLRSQLQPQARVILEFAARPRGDWMADLPIRLVRDEGTEVELTVDDASTIPHVVRAAVMSGGAVLSCRRRDESLAQMFTRLMEDRSC